MRKLWIGLCCCFFLFGCKKVEQPQKFSQQIFDAGFDTVIQIIGYCESQEKFNQYVTKMSETFYHYHQLFDQFHTYEGVANIKTINDSAGKEKVKVDSEIIELLLETKKYYEISNQQYDITSGAVLKIWHKYRENALENKIINIPTLEELQAAKTHTGWDKVEIDTEANTVYLSDPDMSLDLGSAAKGYATEKVAKLLEKDGLKHAIINAGGNIRLIGTKPDKKPWNVGIQIPDSYETKSLATLQFEEEYSFVTSGDYQRNYEYEGKRYHHIIDPSTLYPASYARSITCITKDSTLADILSTTLFTMSYEEGSQLIEDLNEKGILVEAVWVFDDSNDKNTAQTHASIPPFQIAYTDGLADMIQIHNK